jgi:transcriptional regulator with XRE-family HTH domain
MSARKLVAHNLRKLRVAREISQENLAVDASLDRTYIGRLERGLENPTVAVLERLAEALGAQIVEFFAPMRRGERAVEPLRGGRRSNKAGTKAKRSRP